MANAKKLPAKLYKYREFSNRTLDIIVGDNLYFADPTTFNDPLDTKPHLKNDLDAARLEEILRKMVQQRVSAEMTTAAKAIKYRGQKTKDQIDRLSHQQANEIIAEAHYNATAPPFDDENVDEGEALRSLLGNEIERELLRRYDKGVVSLATRPTCPLMWSHYAEQHKGLCIGYSLPDDTISQVHKVSYRGSRLVEASAVLEMLAGNPLAQRRVDEAVLLRKAPDWRYEKEWRLLGERGVQGSRLELNEIIFGLRCTDAVQFSVVSALAGRSKPVKFYRIGEQTGQFKLQKRLLDIAELCASLPRRYRDLFECFQPIVEPTPQNEPSENAAATHREEPEAA